jgi:hypothetical protein
VINKITSIVLPLSVQTKMGIFDGAALLPDVYARLVLDGRIQLDE